MADNNTKIILTAEDRTAGALSGITRNLQGMSQSAELASRALGAIGVSFTGAAMVAMVKGTIDAADGFNDLAQRLGIGIKELAGWTLAANQSGTSMETVAKGIKGLSVYMVEHGEKLRAAGITATDANGAMMQLAELFKAMPDPVQRTALAVQLFGKAGMDMLPMLLQGSAGLKEAQEKAEAYGKKMAELAPQADEFNDQLEEMALHSKAAGINITSFMLPGLIGMAKWLGDIATGGEAAQRAVEFLLGERAMKAMVLAGHPGLTGAAPRSVSGKIGGQAPVALTPAEEEALGQRNMAGLRGAGLLDKSGDGASAAPKYKRSFDPEADFRFAVEENLRKQTRAQQEADAKALDAIDAKAKAMDEAHMARMEANRIESEGEEAIREQMEKTSREMKNQDNLARDLGISFTSAFEDAVISGKKFRDVLGGLAQDVARIFLRKQVTEPMAAGIGGMLKGFDFGNIFSKLFGDGGAGVSLAGGGYTGDGARAGGLDGQGGFLAMMHPQETVVDHASGQSVGAPVTVQVNFAVGIAQTVRAEVMNLMPQIQAAAKAGVMDARLRGGSTRAAFSG